MRFALASFLLMLSAGPGFAKFVELDSDIPGYVSGEVEVSCDNKGPKITFGGIVATEDIDAVVKFSNNQKGTHTAEETVEASMKLYTKEYPIQFAKQPPLGGVGGNPHIFFSPDCYDYDFYLGRCVQGGGGEIDYDTLLEYAGEWEVKSGDCHNHPGPFVTLEGKFTLSAAVEGCFLFKNSLKNPQHVREEEGDIVVKVTILDEDETITIPKQPVRGGAGGNPRIYLRFDDEDGNGLSDELYLGRCVQLAK